MELCEKSLIEKTRYHVLENGNLWEVDVFGGENKGLTVAEIELESENQDFFYQIGQEKKFLMKLNITMLL